MWIALNKQCFMFCQLYKRSMTVKRLHIKTFSDDKQVCKGKQPSVNQDTRNKQYGNTPMACFGVANWHSVVHLVRIE